MPFERPFLIIFHFVASVAADKFVTNMDTCLSRALSRQRASGLKSEAVACPEGCEGRSSVWQFQNGAKRPVPTLFAVLNARASQQLS